MDYAWNFKDKIQTESANEGDGSGKGNNETQGRLENTLELLVSYLMILFYL